MKTTSLTGLPLAALLLAALPALAQTGNVGIGTTIPDASAALDVSSTTQGLLPPRLTQTQRDAVKTPAAGLVVFNTDTGVLNTWDGMRWVAALADTTPTSTSFAYIGSPQTYTVPAGVFSLVVDAAGGSGQGVIFSSGGGGLGGRVQATLAVVPGQVLTIYVGQTGTAAGGYNGGGAGVSNSIFGITDGGGGGASDVRTGAAGLADRVLVAGGGGGAGIANGGAAGGVSGTAGSSYGSGGGQGGTASSGGAGGSYGAATGGAGTAGSGGAGNGGVGGGGGYYGGGGGAYGGGGGGSSYAGPGTSAVVHTPGYQTGNGYVTLHTPVPATTPAPYLDGSNITAGVIKNQTAQQVGANFNIDGTGAVGRLGVGTSAPFTQLTNGDGTTNVIGTDSYGVGTHSINWASAEAGYVGGFYNGANAGSAGGLAVKVASASAAALDVSQGGTAAGAGTPLLRVSGGGNVGVGTSSPATRLDVNGNLRLAVRLCPVNQPVYVLTAADVAYSIFKVEDGHFANFLALPDASGGQVEGQELTVLTRATTPCTIGTPNTDSTTAVALVADNVSGTHAARYVWALPASGTGRWLRVQ